MKFGLSSLIYERELRGKLKSGRNVKKLYIDHINRTIKVAAKNDLRIIEICIIPNSSKILFSVLSEIKEKIKVFDEVTFHLPWKGRSTDEIKDCIKFANSLDIKILVCHPILIDPLIYGKIIEIEDDIGDLISLCRKQGSMLCFENLPAEVPKFNRSDEFDNLIEKGGFLTLDTGHAITCGINPITFVNKFKDKIKHIHLQDGFKGRPDVHYAVGNGELDYITFLNKLEEMNYKEIVMLELVSEKDLTESITRLREFI